PGVRRPAAFGSAAAGRHRVGLPRLTRAARARPAATHGRRLGEGGLKDQGSKGNDPISIGFGRRGLVEERDQPRAWQPARVVRRGGAGGGRHGGADVRARDRAGPVAGRLRFGGRDGGGHGGDHGRRGGGHLDAAGRFPAPGG